MSIAVLCESRYPYICGPGPSGVGFYDVMSAASDDTGAWPMGVLPLPPSLRYRWIIRLNFNVQEEIIMSNTSFRLMEYHQRLDSQLRSELRRRLPDMLRIQKLKKLKLAVKDRLSRLALGVTRKRTMA
jgi:uncharacterized protein